MVTQASTVGGLALPLDAGTADADWDDPLTAGIASYLAHWLNADLNPRLANLSARPDEAVPAANVHLHNPGRSFTRAGLPALYVWRASAQKHPWSTVTSELRSTVRALWIFTELTKPEGIAAMNAIHGVVASTLARATQLCRHATWSHGAHPAGTDIRRALTIDGWDMTGPVQLIEAMPEPGDKPITAARNSGGDSAEQRFFPVVQANWLVREFIGQHQAEYLNAGIAAQRLHDGLDLNEDRFIPHPGPTLPDPP